MVLVVYRKFDGGSTMKVEIVAGHGEGSLKLARGADVAVMESSGTGGSFCHIMTLDKELANKIQTSCGWEEIKTSGLPDPQHISMLATDVQGPEVLAALKKVV